MVFRQTRPPVDGARRFRNDPLYDERQHGQEIRFEEVYRVDEDAVGRNAGALACMSAKHERYCYHPRMFDPRQKPGKRKHSRGYLPHFDVYEATQFVTFRLADSMPQELLKAWKHELQLDEITDVEFRKRIEKYLDSGYGSCALRDPKIANVIRETLLKWNGERYELIAWVIMPNHVHILIRLLGESLLTEIMHSIKSYTAHQANKILGLSGRFWSVESFDRYIRNADHFRNTIKYIEANPVKAGLCKDSGDWEFGSAFRPEEVD